jgi:hypothetical protein
MASLRGVAARHVERPQLEVVLVDDAAAVGRDGRELHAIVLVCVTCCGAPTVGAMRHRLKIPSRSDAK